VRRTYPQAPSALPTLDIPVPARQDA